MKIVTGLPRMRSAWLSAILSTVGETEHETKDWKTGILVDPFALLLVDWRNASRLVYVHRDPNESRIAWEKWQGVKCPQHIWHDLVYAANECKDTAGLIVRYEFLEQKKALDILTEYLELPTVSDRVWRLFDGLKVEQHLEKAKLRN